MNTPAEINAVAEVLSDPDNASASAEEVAAMILALVDGFRRRPFRYVTIAQDRRRDPETTPGRASYPTWVRGPFQTLAEARMAAMMERGPHAHPTGIKVMTAQVFSADEPVDPETLKEVLA